MIVVVEGLLPAFGPPPPPPPGRGRTPGRAGNGGGGGPVLLFDMFFNVWNRSQDTLALLASLVTNNDLGDGIARSLFVWRRQQAQRTAARGALPPWAEKMTCEIRWSPP